MITGQQLNLTKLCMAYNALLSNSRGQALRLSAEHVALQRDDNLFIALVTEGKVDLGNAAELDANALVAAAGDWSKDKVEAAINAVLTPAFVALVPANLCDFNVDAVCFEYEGDHIQDPTISECGRFSESPEYYGFAQLHGGEWSLGLDDGDRLQVDRDCKTFSRFNVLGEVIAHVTIDAIKFDFEKETT